MASLVPILASAQDFKPGEVLVVCVEGVPSSLCEDAVLAVGARVLARYESVGVLLATTAPGFDELSTVSLLEADPLVDGASLNYLDGAGTHQVVPNDPQFGRQWGLHNTSGNLLGAGPLGGPAIGIVDADIDAPQAWQHQTSCANEVVAVLDSGVDITHADFGGNAPAGNIWVNPGDSTFNNNDNDANGILDDVNGANFASRETYVDNVTANTFVDAGEPIYIDVDSTRSVTAADTLVAGPAAAVGSPLRDFLSQERHAENVAANGVYDGGETIYFDNNNDSMVDAGDVLVAGPAQPNGTALINFAIVPNNNVTDVTGHGTNVASVIGAFGNNNTNIAGVCWRVQLLTVKVARPALPPAPPGPGGIFIGDRIAGINYVVALRTRAMNAVNVRIINNSSGSNPGGRPASVPENAAITAAANAGILFVTAAGNNNLVNVDAVGNQVFPCNYTPAPDNVLCVAGSNNRDLIATFSNFGTVSVDLAAPGRDIIMLQNGGGTTIASGTSFATPMVAGIAAHFWSLPGFTTHTLAQLRARLLTGTNGPVGVAHPHGVDPRSGLNGRVVTGINNDGRARMTMGDDFGDAPDPAYPTLIANNGARHEDTGGEWLGQPAVSSDVSPEFDADDAAAHPPDPDGIDNLPDRDDHDDGIGLVGPFVFSPGAGGPIVATVEVYVDTENKGSGDADNGRYGGAAHTGVDGVHGAGDDRHLWVNAFFDWNIDGDWDDPNEHVFSLRADPSVWATSDGHYTVKFNMPMKPATVNPGTRYARFRLDYGENAGRALVAPPHAVGPSAGGRVKFWDDPGGLPEAGPAAQRYGSVTGAQALNLTRGVAQFGEVEDYPVHGEGALAVVLTDFGASVEGANVRLSWDTASEIDNLGFRVLRSSRERPRFSPVSGVIPAAGGPSSGASYDFLDDTVGPEETYHYLLEDIDVFGVSTLHGTGGCTYLGDSRRCPPLVVTTPALSAAEFCASHPIRPARRARLADEDACRSADWGANEPGRRNPQDCRVYRGRPGRGPVCGVGPNAD